MSMPKDGSGVPLAIPGRKEDGTSEHYQTPSGISQFLPVSGRRFPPDLSAGENSDKFYKTAGELTVRTNFDDLDVPSDGFNSVSPPLATSTPRSYPHTSTTLSQFNQPGKNQLSCDSGTVYVREVPSAQLKTGGVTSTEQGVGRGACTEQGVGTLGRGARTHWDGYALNSGGGGMNYTYRTRNNRANMANMDGGRKTKCGLVTDNAVQDALSLLLGKAVHPDSNTYSTVSPTCTETTLCSDNTASLDDNGGITVTGVSGGDHEETPGQCDNSMGNCLARHKGSTSEEYLLSTTPPVTAGDRRTGDVGKAVDNETNETEYSVGGIHKADQIDLSCENSSGEGLIESTPESGADETVVCTESSHNRAEGSTDGNTHTSTDITHTSTDGITHTSTDITDSRTDTDYRHSYGGQSYSSAGQSSEEGQSDLDRVSSISTVSTVSIVSGDSSLTDVSTLSASCVHSPAIRDDIAISVLEEGCNPTLYMPTGDLSDVSSISEPDTPHTTHTNINNVNSIEGNSGKDHVNIGAESPLGTIDTVGIDTVAMDDTVTMDMLYKPDVSDVSDVSGAAEGDLTYTAPDIAPGNHPNNCPSNQVISPDNQVVGADSQSDSQESGADGAGLRNASAGDEDRRKAGEVQAGEKGSSGGQREQGEGVIADNTQATVQCEERESGQKGDLCNMDDMEEETLEDVATKTVECDGGNTDQHSDPQADQQADQQTLDRAIVEVESTVIVPGDSDTPCTGEEPSTSEVDTVAVSLDNPTPDTPPVNLYVPTTTDLDTSESDLDSSVGVSDIQQEIATEKHSLYIPTTADDSDLSDSEDGGDDNGDTKQTKPHTNGKEDSDVTSAKVNVDKHAADCNVVESITDSKSSELSESGAVQGTQDGDSVQTQADMDVDTLILDNVNRGEDCQQATDLHKCSTPQPQSECDEETVETEDSPPSLHLTTDSHRGSLSPIIKPVHSFTFPLENTDETDQADRGGGDKNVNFSTGNHTEVCQENQRVEDPSQPRVNSTCTQHSSGGRGETVNIEGSIVPLENYNNDNCIVHEGGPQPGTENMGRYGKDRKQGQSHIDYKCLLRTWHSVGLLSICGVPSQ